MMAAGFTGRCQEAGVARRDPVVLQGLAHDLREHAPGVRSGAHGAGRGLWRWPWSQRQQCQRHAHALMRRAPGRLRTSACVWYCSMTGGGPLGWVSRAGWRLMEQTTLRRRGLLLHGAARVWSRRPCCMLCSSAVLWRIVPEMRHLIIAGHCLLALNVTRAAEEKQSSDKAWLEHLQQPHTQRCLRCLPILHYATFSCITLPLTAWI